MALVLFDLDETLLAGDSDYEWGKHLVSMGKVDRAVYERENERFYREYLAGKLNIHEYLRFALRPLAKNSYNELCRWREEYIETRIKPMIKPKARATIEQHREAGDHLAIITATNRFITAPVQDILNVTTLIATEPEMKGGRFTGNVEGVPCFGRGKITRVKEWLASNSYSLEGSQFYSDSHNDIPLLEMVDHPIAVDADEKLTEHAIKKGWQQLSLK